MLIRAVVTTVTVRCATCKMELHSAEEMSKHARWHTMQRLHATAWGRRYIAMYRCNSNGWCAVSRPQLGDLAPDCMWPQLYGRTSQKSSFGLKRERFSET